MRFVRRQVTAREIPHETSISYLISGCLRKCPDCQWADSWSPHAGEELTLELYQSDLVHNLDSITCVLFLGGDWYPEQLIERLKIARSMDLKTALYSGEEYVSPRITSHLNYLKLGPYKRDRGGLDNPNTNQRLYNVDTGSCLNPLITLRGPTGTQVNF